MANFRDWVCTHFSFSYISLVILRSTFICSRQLCLDKLESQLKLDCRDVGIHICLFDIWTVTKHLSFYLFMIFRYFKNVTVIWNGVGYDEFPSLQSPFVLRMNSIFFFIQKGDDDFHNEWEQILQIIWELMNFNESWTESSTTQRTKIYNTLRHASASHKKFMCLRHTHAYAISNAQQPISYSARYRFLLKIETSFSHFVLERPAVRNGMHTSNEKGHCSSTWLHSSSSNQSTLLLLILWNGHCQKCIPRIDYFYSGRGACFYCFSFGSWALASHGLNQTHADDTVIYGVNKANTR